MLHYLIVLLRKSTGVDYPLQWDAKHFGILSTTLMALAAKPEHALKEKLCRQLLSLAALERLEPQQHVAIRGSGPVVSKQLKSRVAAWISTLESTPREGTGAAARVGDDGERYVVHRDLHKKRQPDEGVRQDPKELKQRQKEQGWDNETKRQRLVAKQARKAFSSCTS